MNFLDVTVRRLWMIELEVISCERVGSGAPTKYARECAEQPPDNRAICDIDLDGVDNNSDNYHGNDSHRMPRMKSPAFRVGLIDPLCFSRDCLITALRTICPQIVIVALSPPAEHVSAGLDLDTILFHSHEEGPLGPSVLKQVTKLKAAFRGIPIILISDSISTLRLGPIRAAINSGASAVIPAITSKLNIIEAALQIVRTGGVFAPADVLLSPRLKSGTDSGALQGGSSLTARELSVLAQLRHGDANKVIASKLGMAESTVKVHVHNIMRKLGATNRTQAVFKGEELLSYFSLEGLYRLEGLYHAPPDEALSINSQ
jgi:DNA-binding NarL/FixJ family response regulator